MFTCFLLIFPADIQINPSKQIKSSTLADQINLTLSTISDWNNFSEIFTRGIVFDKVNVNTLDLLAQKSKENNDWGQVFRIKRQADIMNYDSAIINETLKWALCYAPMFDSYSLPITRSDGFFWMWYQWALYGYKYARELDYLVEKWNAESAFIGLRNCRITNGRAFYEANPDTNSTKSLFGTRWMNLANLANSFLILYNETLSSEALNFALQEWNDLNYYYWDNDQQGYMYSMTWRTWEWSSIGVFFSFEHLRSINGSLNYWDRVYHDLQNRYLTKKWESPQWSQKVVVHSQGAAQRRLHGTLDAWMLLLTYFGNFNTQNQQNMKDMLEGNGITPAWEALLSPEANLYDSSTYRFRLDSDKSLSDYASAEASLTLFLMGLSPQNGSGLLIPKRSEEYSAEPFSSDVFRFSYPKRQIIIPVYGNTTLKFLYGSIYPEYTFPLNGIYNITFSSDWNAINEVELIKEIPVVIKKPNITTTIPTQTSSSTSSFSTSTNSMTSDLCSSSSKISTTSTLPSSTEKTILAFSWIYISFIFLLIKKFRSKRLNK